MPPAQVSAGLPLGQPVLWLAGRIQTHFRAIGSHACAGIDCIGCRVVHGDGHACASCGNTGDAAESEKRTSLEALSFALLLCRHARPSTSAHELIDASFLGRVALAIRCGRRRVLSQGSRASIHAHGRWSVECESVPTVTLTLRFACAKFRVSVQDSRVRVCARLFGAWPRRKNQTGLRLLLVMIGGTRTATLQDLPRPSPEKHHPRVGTWK